MWIGQSEIDDGVVKIKILNDATEEFVKREDMVRRVGELVKEHPVLLAVDE